MPGKRIPTRGKSTGSVRIVTPKKLMSPVECPSHASVTCVSSHFDGVGLAKAGAIGRQLSIVHSLNRCPSQRHTLDLRGAGCCGACTLERNTAIMAAGSAGWKPARRNRQEDRKSTRLNSSHLVISYAVFCLKKQTS